MISLLAAVRRVRRWPSACGASAARTSRSSRASRLYLVVVVVAGLLMPTVNEVGDFPADTLWYFRRASIITLATMWAGIGVLLVGLVGRLHRDASTTAARREPGGQPVRPSYRLGRGGRRARPRGWAALATPPARSAGSATSACGSAPRRARSRRAELTDVRLVIFAGDHGVSAHGVSAYPAEITAAMVRTFLSGKAAVSALARAHGVKVRVLDLGVDDDLDGRGPPRCSGSRYAAARRRSTSRTRSPPRRPARRWRPAQPWRPEEIAAGAQLLISGDMGIGNTTPAAALIAAGLGLPASEVTGRGTGIDDQAVAHKQRIVAAGAGPRRRTGD